MKRLIWIIICLLTASVGQLSAFPIRSIDVRMDIQPDSSVLATETIVADFTGEPHHGIYRDIPFSGKDRYGNNYRIRHEVLGVTDQNGNPLTTSTSMESGRLHIRIGDPNTLVSDVRTYVIRYRLWRAVRFFDQQGELYWNAVGPEWEVPIQRARCVVTLPSDVPKGGIRTAAFSGFYGSTASDIRTTVPDSRTVVFDTTRQLNPGESMTVVVGWPKGIVTPPSRWQTIKWAVADNGYFLLPPIFLLLIVVLWSYMGKDPDTGRSETVSFDPPDDLRPAEVGTLIDERVDIRDISATIVDLAVRGYIHITVETTKGLFTSKNDYLLELQKPYEEAQRDPGLKDFERKIITALFSAGQSRWMSSLSNSFYVNLPTLRDYLYESMITHGYFTHRPDSVRTGYQTAGIVIFAVGVFLAIFAGSAGIIPVGWSLALALCGIILAIAARMMPKKTAKGKNALLAVRGFEEYISRAERQEIEYQERNNYFEKFLPYAMAFGIAAKWAKAFDGIQTTPPSWYSGNAGVFYPSIFAHDMTAASANWQSDMVSQPRSSGSGSDFYSGGSGFSGGSSGGGGGGGGGGGW